MLYSKSSPASSKQKQLKTKFYNLKQTVRRIPLQVIARILVFCCVLCALYAFSLSHHHRLPPWWSSPPTNVTKSIPETNSTTPSRPNDTDSHSAKSALTDDLNLSHLNLSQLNMFRFVRDWGKTPTTRSPTPSPTAPRSIWSRNVSGTPPRSLNKDALKDIVIPNVVWDFGSCGCTGWGIETVNIIESLSERVDDIKLITDYDCWCPGFPDDTLDLMNGLQSNEEYLEWNPIEIFVSHKPPSRYPRFPYHGIIDIEQRPSIVIGRSMTEVDWVSPEDVERLKSSEWIDELWVPSRFVKIVYVQHGVHPNRIRVIPIPINVGIYNKEVRPYKSLPSRHEKAGRIEVSKATFRFLSVFKWEPRKGVDVLLRAFLKAFSKSDDVQLYLQTYAYDQSDLTARSRDNLERKLNATLTAIIAEDDELRSNAQEVWEWMFPKIEVMTKERTMDQLASLYKTVDCLVSASHGEGFGLPVLEAMAVGTPVVVTNWSGLRDLVINESYGYLVAVDGKEFARNTPGRGDFVEDKMKWAAIDGDSLVEKMRAVYDDRKEAKRRGRMGQKYVMKHFHPKVVTDKIERRMKELIYHKNTRSAQ